MIKTRQETIIDVGDWDALVEKTYGRRYSFQQQDGCKERQHVHISVPDNAYDYESDTVQARERIKAKILARKLTKRKN